MENMGSSAQKKGERSEKALFQGLSLQRNVDSVGWVIPKPRAVLTAVGPTVRDWETLTRSI